MVTRILLVCFCCQERKHRSQKGVFDVGEVDMNCFNCCVHEPHGTFGAKMNRTLCITDEFFGHAIEPFCFPKLRRHRRR